MNAPIQIPEFSVGSVVKLIRESISKSVTDALPGAGALLQVRGRLSKVRIDPRYRVTRDIKISDGVEELQLEVANEILLQHGFVGGEDVAVTGILKTDFSRYTEHRVAIRLDVSEVRLLDPAAAAAVSTKGRATTESLKGLEIRRHPFPAALPLKLSVIHSKSGQAMVDEDFLHEITKLGNLVEVERIAVNMLSASDIAGGVERATGNVIAIIRGGGDESQFDVFDMLVLLKSLADKKAYRVTGLGHSANRTLLDLVADFSANTPTHAGVHIRESVERARAAACAVDAQVAGIAHSAASPDLQQLLAEKDRSINELKRELAGKRRRPIGALVVTHGLAFFCGAVALVVLVRAFRALM